MFQVDANTHDKKIEINRNKKKNERGAIENAKKKKKESIDYERKRFCLVWNLTQEALNEHSSFIYTLTDQS